MTSRFGLAHELATWSHHADIVLRLEIWRDSKFSGQLEIIQNFISDGLRQLTTLDVTYENSINMKPLPFHNRSSGPFAKGFFNYGQTPLINIFDARVASEDRRSFIRAWPTARAASNSKAWLHYLTHRYLVLSHLVRCVFSLFLIKKTAFVFNHQSSGSKQYW